MYFISYWTYVFSITNFLHHPQTFNSAKLFNLNGISETPRDNLELGSNFSYFSLCLTDNLTMTNFSRYPPTFNWAKRTTSNMFSEAPRGQIKKVRIFALLFAIHWYGLDLFLHADAASWIEVL